MFKDHLTTAVRIFLKQKIYSFINILGLSAGIAITLLMVIYVIDELSYDRFFADADKIYRVAEHEKYDGTEMIYVESGAPIAEALRKDIPGVLSSVRTAYVKDQIVRYGDKAFIEKRMLYADSTFFDIFSYPLLLGNPKECLRGPHKIVLTTSAARKYFGDAPAMGNILDLGDGKTAIITGVMPDVPHNTHMKFDMVLSMDSWDFALQNDQWDKYDLHNYFRVADLGVIPVVEKRLAYYMKDYLIPQLEEEIGASVTGNGNDVHYILQPLPSIHLHSRFNGEFEANGDIRYVYIFSAAAIFIILIACINFMNLATARGAERAKEVGVRKAIGATRRRLVNQFMTESFLYVLLSGILALIMIVVMLGPFNLLSGKNLTMGIFADLYFLAIAAGFIVMVGCIAGSYPAFYLTSFKPVAVLKGVLTTGTKRYTLRNVLVIFQFAISLGLIISTLVIYNQLEFIRRQNVGFDRLNLLLIQRTNDLGKNRQAFKDELMRDAQFMSASMIHQAPPDVTETLMLRNDHDGKAINAFWGTSDGDYAQTVGVKMISGRFFDTNAIADSTAMVMNETAAKLIDNPKPGDRVIVSNQKLTLVGIMEDYNFESLHGSIAPIVIMPWNYYHALVVRIAPGHSSEAVSAVEKAWNKFAPGTPLQYSFVDDDFNAKFQTEQKMGKLFWIFTVLAILIACLGLFGLITLVSSQRAKEISIRKVLGASIPQITMLLSGELVKLVIISFLVAVPLTWYGMERWLEGFAYRTNFDFMIVVYSGVAGILIAVLTVVYKSFKTAASNPLKALKSE